MTRVLVVDDDPALRRIYELALRHQGFDVVVVGNGREALGALREPLPDVVMTDLDMPGLDGLGLCRTLRARADTASLPVLILTGSDFDEGRLTEALQLQPLAVRRKPTPLRSLGRLLEAVMDLGRAAETRTGSGSAQLDRLARTAEVAGGADRLLPGEDPETTDPRTVERWLGIYSDLLDFKTSLIEQTRQRYAGGGPAMRAELGSSDLPFLLAEAARFERRVAAWERRREEVAGRVAG